MSNRFQILEKKLLSIFRYKREHSRCSQQIVSDGKKQLIQLHQDSSPGTCDFNQ